ncbi:hypothetical protein ACZ87_01362 [Candidatus Erwinia dacicola]|uniref:Uncharacterized protein n=1 Tax=Candidatus Erwinia dacicola TaxID=252393 RepID=A0A328TMJ1_9GAMM|nr:hypothetical protein ACZ87_01362 [Candidatus Erwinia dacicola]
MDNADCLQGITFGKQRSGYKIHVWLKNNLSVPLRRDYARSSLTLTRAVQRPASKLTA